MATPLALAKRLMLTLHADLPQLIRIDNYLHGHHDDPYQPDSAGSEYKLLARRSVTNLLPLVVDASAQSLYVDSVRPGRDIPETPAGGKPPKLPEWQHWQVSRLDARQVAVHRDALAYGHAFTVTEERGGKIQTRGLGALNTTALFADAANDETPVAALTVNEWPSDINKGIGEATMWDETSEYLVYFKSLGDVTDDSVVIEAVRPHGSAFCPVTRFAARVDLNGRTWGVIEPLLVLQDRINQTVFDLMVVQTGGAFEVRTVTGMAPPYKMTYEIDGVTGEKRLVPLVNPDTGEPVIDNVQVNAMKFLYAEDPETKFGSLPASPLDGYLKAIDDAFKTLSAISQTPPFFLLGAIANLSADALQAAMTGLERKVGEFRNVFGESWERVFRLAAELSGIAGATDDYDTEVVWRDMNARVLATVADGLLKLRQAGAPLEGILALVPGMTRNMLENWLSLVEDEQAELAEQNAVAAQAASLVRNRRASSTPVQQTSDAAAARAQTGADKVP